MSTKQELLAALALALSEERAPAPPVQKADLTKVEDLLSSLDLTLAELVETLAKLATGRDAEAQQQAGRGAQWKVVYPTVHGQQTMIVERTA